MSEWQRFERLTQVIVSKYVREMSILVLVGGSVPIGYEELGYTLRNKKYWTIWAISCPEPSLGEFQAVIVTCV